MSDFAGSSLSLLLEISPAVITRRASSPNCVFTEVQAMSLIVPSARARVHPGDRYNRLLVLGEPFRIRHTPTSERQTFVVCQCDCGRVVAVAYAALRVGDSQSCGCLVREISSARCVRELTKHGEARLGRTTRLYRIWRVMHARCLNPQYHQYRYWGGRGIRICSAWMHDYTAFRDWALANGYRDDLVIDRRDNAGDYTPENCAWVDRYASSRNRRNVHPLTAFGETKTIPEWAEDPRCVVGLKTLGQRIRQGYGTPEEAITQPSRKQTKRNDKIRAFGEAKTVAQWVRDPRCMVSYCALVYRLDRGIKPEEAIARLSLTNPRTGDELW